MLSISGILSYLVHIYSGILLIYCVFSWIPGSRGAGILGDIYRILAKICDPFLNLFRKIIPPIGGTIDISPILAIIVLQIIVNLVARFLG